MEKYVCSKDKYDKLIQGDSRIRERWRKYFNEMFNKDEQEEICQQTVIGNDKTGTSRTGTI